MNIKNSRSIKLKKQQKALKTWRENGSKILIINAFISLIPFAFVTSLNMGLLLTILGVSYCAASIASLCVHLGYSCEKMRKRIADIDIFTFSKNVFMRIIIPCICISATCYLCVSYFDSAWRVLLTIGCSLVMGLLSIWWTALTVNEKLYVRNALHKIIKKNG